MYNRNQTQRFENQSDLIMFLIFGIVGGVPIPLIFGLIRMTKNRLLGLFCGAEWRKAKRLKRQARNNGKGVRRRRSWGLGVLALVCIVGAKWFRNGDTTWMCTDVWGPESWFQAHAVWHSGCALAVMFVYLFLRSEVFNMYGYVSKYEADYADESKNWIERQVEKVEDLIEYLDGETKEECVRRKSQMDLRQVNGGKVNMKLVVKERENSLDGIGNVL